MPLNFWMVVCNAENFRITRERGFNLLGLKPQHRRKVQRIGNGDRILYYVTHKREFTATVTATASFFEDDTPIWEKEGGADWPYRIEIKPEIVLDDSQYIDANLLAPRLEYVKRWTPENWYMAFQGNLHLLPKADFLLIEEEMKKLKFGKDYRPTPALQPPSGTRKRKSGSRRHGGRGGGQRQAPAASGPTAQAPTGAGGPASSGTTAPASSGTTAPASSGTTAPASSGTTAPVSPGTTPPASPGTTAPVSPGTTPPASPGPAAAE